jgi:putative ABC transport system ATP-binding protein
MLEKLCISHKAAQYPFQLSGGQQQRCAVARALVTNPALILADEPTGNLDVQHSTELMQVFREINNDGVTLIMVTHSEYLAHQTDRILFLSDGRIVLDKTGV